MSSSSPFDIASMSESQFSATLQALLDGDNSASMEASTLLPPAASTALPNNDNKNAEHQTATTGEAESSKVNLFVNSALDMIPSAPVSVPAASVAQQPNSTVAVSSQALAAPPTISCTKALHVTGNNQQQQQQSSSLFPPSPMPSSSSFAVVKTESNLPSLPDFPAVGNSATMLPPPSKLPAPKTTKKRRRPASRSSIAVSEDEGELEKRRLERNQREQQRSNQVTLQIALLRDILKDSKVRFKPDKFSTLSTVVDYVKNLQDKTTILESEHKTLLDTISRTSEIVNNQYVSNSAADMSAQNDDSSNDLLASPAASPPLQDEAAGFLQGLDYKNFFNSCPLAVAVLSVDGRFIDSNKEFEEFSMHTRNELLPMIKTVPATNAVGSTSGITTQISGSNAAPSSEADAPVQQNLSLFNILSRGNMEPIFVNMSRMLKSALADSSAASASGSSANIISDYSVTTPDDVWCGPVELSRRPNTAAKLCISLVRSPQGRPRFFNCTLIPMD